MIINNRQYKRRLKKDKYYSIILNKKLKKKISLILLRITVNEN